MATDDHLWLEEVDGERALDWVRSQNERSLEVLEGHPLYSEFEAEALELLTSNERIAYGSVRDGHVYNFWQDDEHVRGIWRRATYDSYIADEPVWQTLLDIDQLADDEDENWVFAGASACRFDGQPITRYLISLSIGGRDATTVREYDVDAGAFVADGFVSPESKQSVSWVDPDTILIATDWGDDSMTESGYPLSVRRVRRGQSLDEAEELVRGEATDVGVWPVVLRRADDSRIVGAVQRLTFFTGALWLLRPGADSPTRLPIPDKADLTAMVDDIAIISLQQDWQPDGQREFSSGDLVALDLAAFLATGDLPTVELVFRPTERQSVQGISVSSERVVLNYSDNVVSNLAWLDRTDDGVWKLTPIDLPGSGSAGVTSSDSRESAILVSYHDFLTPDSLMLLEPDGDLVTIKGLTPRFSTEGLTVTQRSVTSTDGTDVPYFLVHRDDIEPDGSTPTVLYGYGGFEISMTPSYSPTLGRFWLERGGAYALANIRGGGEFGPAWHQAGLKTKRQVVYDDFIAVAEDLIATGVTSADRLGAMGGSNGGLLMGVMLTQRPDLWRGLVIQVPLLDMLRYHLLLAGASWVDEYGSPDVPDERAFLETISPYHRFDPAADYPTPLFVTSTKDDRVHPGHARKMAKRFEDADLPFLYYENIDGGHGAATNQIERARRLALEYVYLTERLT